MELEKTKKALNYQLNMRNTDIFMIPNFEAISAALNYIDIFYT